MEFMKNTINKIKNNEKLTERELKTLIFEYEYSTIEGDSSRWTKSMTTISRLEEEDGTEHFYSTDWREGLTEMQENEFYYQPIEVFPKKAYKIVEVTEWIKK